MENIVLFLSNYVLELVKNFGYLGIILGMAIESSLVPLPSEIVMIPAGVLAYSGEMNFFIVVFCGVLGSYLGSLANYILAYFCGRPIILRYGKYFFFNEEKLKKVEAFFLKFGNISIFIARLIPVVRHFISIPAGFAKMNFWQFSFYTVFGSTIWMIILTAVGYFIGQNAQEVHKLMPILKIGTLFVCIIFVVYFVMKVYKKRLIKN
jgi:membrane protein DedA with SNARE-associated domain